MEEQKPKKSAEEIVQKQREQYRAYYANKKMKKNKDKIEKVNQIATIITGEASTEYIGDKTLSESKINKVLIEWLISLMP